MPRLDRLPQRLSRKLGLVRVFGYPEEVQIVPTNACNLRCMQCPKTWYDTDNRTMDRRVYEKIREQVLPHVRMLNLQGLGEPLLSPLFPRMLDDALEFGLQVRFVTNTMLLKSEYIPRIVRTGGSVTFSIDGATDATHGDSRPTNSLDSVLAAIQSIVDEQRRQPNSGFQIHINTVVTTRNVEELEGILDYCIRFGAASWQLLNPGVGARQDEFARAAIGSHPERLARCLPALLERAARNGIGISYPHFVRPDAGSTAESSTPPPGRLFPGRCRDPWSMVYIDVDGWVRPCCRAIWIGMGNVLAESFHSIWNNAAYRRLRETIHSDNPPDFCRTCSTDWGITLGDERYVEKLAGRGIVLPKAPYIGTTYPEEGQPPPDMDAPIGNAPRTTPNVVGRRAGQATSESNR